MPAKGPLAKRFAERVLASRRLVIGATLLGVAVASSGIARLEFAADYRIFFDEHNPQLLALEELENTYGKSENIAFLIVLDDGDATSEDALRPPSGSPRRPGRRRIRGASTRWRISNTRPRTATICTCAISSTPRI